MTMTPIKQAWDEFAHQTEFCCEAHREQAKTTFMLGAMATFHCVTGWNPDRPEQPLRVSLPDLTIVSAELTTAYHDQDTEAGHA
ncbi:MULTISPECIES: hypothetical protein [unclassified Bradyrhizobium]|uniref:hypothetical protein n=1 Tax=unclassified Bradyrhizobium TaxID=2631580 RepID=UPI0028E62BE1|nr:MULTISPECIES: hypothetical protein [unclassified Bradyrhizobium]